MRKFDAAENREKLRPRLGLLFVLACASGCQDGPMFALKQVNPYYRSYEWAADEKLGPTDATREAELKLLAGSIASMPASEQRRWVGELENLMEHDPSAHMRCQAVRAAAQAEVPEALAVIRKGLEDDHTKVRIASCDALGSRQEAEATDLLVARANSETEKDVRLAAIKSLGTHSGASATDALKLALKEPDLAYQHASIASLRQITGRDVGDEPDAWIAMLESPAGSDAGSDRSRSWSERLGNLF